MRHEVEQRRRRDQLDRPIQRRFQVAREIDRDGRYGQIGRFRQPTGARQQAQIVVDQSPALPVRQPVRYCPQGRSQAAGEVDHRNRPALSRPGGDCVAHCRIARAPVVGLAQREPCGREAHTTLSIAAENNFADSAQLGRRSAAAQAPAASCARCSGFSISRRKARSLI